MTLRFVSRLAWRETRAGWRPLAGLVACVALGVAALVGVGSLGASLDAALAREGKTLAGGDLELRSPRPLDAAAEARLAGLVDGGARLARLRELAGMARVPDGRSTLVELKAVDGAWPLYGAVVTRPQAPLADLLAGGGALVDEALLGRLGVRVGDAIDVGAARLTIRGVVAREPDRAGLLALGPRVLIAAEALERTGLLQVGSRVRHRTLVRLPPSVAARPARDALARDLADPGVRVATWDGAQPSLRRFFRQLTTYLGLVGLASLLVGAVGVASSVRAFVRRRRHTLAVLKCLGAPSGTLVLAYLVQAMGLGLAGSLAGAGIGVALQPLLAGLLAGLAPIAVDAGADALSVARGIAMGVLTTALVALWPLLAIRDVPPALVLRQEVEPPARPGRRRWIAALPVTAGLVALTLWQAGSLKIGGIFLGAAVAAVVLLAAVAKLVAIGVRRLPRVPSLAWRQGLANLARPGGHAAGVIVALGAGVMLLVAIAVLEAALARQLDHERRAEAPSFFFVDVQADQHDRFLEVVRETAGATPALTPVVRARLSAVDGEAVTREAVARRRAEGHEATWYFTRDYVLTSTPTLPAGNVVTRGRWWDGRPAGPAPEASVEENAAKHLDVGLGSRLVFDVQGVPLAAEVSSIRRVDWQTLSTNFFVILSPGALDGAPISYVATARVPAAREAAVQDAVAAAFPNVTAVPVRDVLERVVAVLDRIGLAVRVVALFAIASGLVVMVGALAASRYQRLTESVILRTLGATRGAVARIFAVEYACLGAAAGMGGAALASLLSWAVLRFVLEVPWTLEPAALALGVALASAVALAVGFLATFRVLGQKPLPVLRQE